MAIKFVAGADKVFRVHESLAADLLAKEGFTETTPEAFWGAQKLATLEHFLELDTLDPAALDGEEEALVKKLYDERMSAEAAKSDSDVEADEANTTPPGEPQGNQEAPEPAAEEPAA